MHRLQDYVVTAARCQTSSSSTRACSHIHATKGLRFDSNAVSCSDSVAIGKPKRLSNTNESIKRTTKLLFPFDCRSFVPFVAGQICLFRVSSVTNVRAHARARTILLLSMSLVNHLIYRLRSIYGTLRGISIEHRQKNQ